MKWQKRNLLKARQAIKDNNHLINEAFASDAKVSEVTTDRSRTEGITARVTMPLLVYIESLRQMAEHNPQLFASNIASLLGVSREEVDENTSVMREHIDELEKELADDGDDL
jgi:flagellar biosynthesis/type III secretory pathway chaperone